MSARRKKQSFSPEFRDEAVRQVINTGRPIAVVARELGVVSQTLGNWVTKYREEYPPGAEEALSVSERAELSQVQRENRELKLELEFLKKAAAYFAKERR